VIFHGMSAGNTTRFSEPFFMYVEKLPVIQWSKLKNGRVELSNNFSLYYQFCVVDGSLLGLL